MEKYTCAYCGNEYESPLERATCEVHCAEKIKKAEDQKRYEEREAEFVNRVEDIKDIRSKIDEMNKSANELEKKLREDYPDKRSVIDKNFNNTYAVKTRKMSDEECKKLMNEFGNLTFDIAPLIRKIF